MPPRSLPPSDPFFPRANGPRLRWGIIGGGWIAGRFIEALRAHTDQVVAAVATRSSLTANVFAQQFDVPRAFPSVDEMLNAPEIDAVYIAAPADQHLALGLQAIDAGKHVLVEKPFATSAEEALRLTAAGHDRGVLVMEAMWTRYLPQTQVLRTLLADGALGDLRTVTVDHGQAMPLDSPMRKGGPGGGALLDLGIYSVQLASLALGPALDVTAVGRLTPDGTDETSTVVLAHQAGGLSTLTTTLDTFTPSTASINGSLGRIEFASPFYMPFGFALRPAGWAEAPLEWTDESGVALFDALSWQATAFAEFAAEGRTESPLHTHAETIAILDVLDRARDQLGAKG
ncbi:MULTISPECIES: Gfo/Idh/MocA family protein [Demequina]|uniref:Gfo/Idh/MocA family protein n=1 Tax=Demequina TaxID=577469 RepID=UPI000782C120|nr:MULTISPECIES: Gfo/Idh/MocA family oxidoreductase [Demequina]